MDYHRLWQGNVDDKGYPRGFVDGRSGVLIHRFVKLYEVERTPEQLNNLKRFKSHPCPEYSWCINPNCIKLSPSKLGMTYETMPDWRKVYGTDLRGLS